MVPSKLIEGLPGCVKKQAVDLFGIDQAEFIEMVWQSEDDMVIRHVDELLAASHDPPLFIRILTLRAVSVTTRVVSVVFFTTRATSIQLST